MTWYFWVWGTLSCLALLALLVALVVGIAYMLETRKHQLSELQQEVKLLEHRVKVRDEKILKQMYLLDELRKDQNEFGRISP